MNLHPYIASQLANERHREILAQAEKQRLVAQAVAVAKQARHSDKNGQRTRVGIRRVLRLGLAPR